MVRVYTIYCARMILIRIKMFSLDWLEASQNFMEKSPLEVKAHDLPNNFTRSFRSDSNLKCSLLVFKSCHESLSVGFISR